MIFWIYKIGTDYEIFDEEPGSYVIDTMNDLGYVYIKSVESDTGEVIDIEGSDYKINYNNDVFTLDSI